MPTMQLTQEVYPFDEYTFIIEYDYTPPQRGRYSGPPEDCYPDEPEELEITSVKLRDCPFVAPDTELMTFIYSDAMDTLHAAVLDHIHDNPDDQGDIPDHTIYRDYGPEDFE